MYITIEGLDGSGKTSLIQKIERRYENVVVTAEPWEEHFTGKAVREALKKDTASMTDAFLFFADRAEHLEKKVIPALSDGYTVVSDRSADSTFAYQTARVKDVLPMDPFDWFEAVYKPWDLEPDLTLYLDISVETALDRSDRFEKYETRKRLEEVRQNYERLNQRFSHRYKRIDAEQPMLEVTDAAFEIIDDQIRRS